MIVNMVKGSTINQLGGLVRIEKNSSNGPPKKKKNTFGQFKKKSFFGQIFPKKISFSKIRTMPPPR